MEELKVCCTHRNRIDKLTQIQNIQETHAHTKPSAIKIIHIDNMAKHTEKHVGTLCCFESHICKLERNHMYKSRIGNTLRIFSNRSFDTFFIQKINTKALNENIEAAPGTPCFPGKCTSKTYFREINCEFYEVVLRFVK